MTTTDNPAEPTSTIDETLKAALSDAYTAETASRARDPHTVSASGLGGCLRQLAYKTARTPATSQPGHRECRAANLGTYVHAGLLPRIAESLAKRGMGPVDTELKVSLKAAGSTINGRADLVAGNLLVDIKSTNEHTLDAIAESGKPTPEHLMQALAYALALRQAGRKITTVCVVYVDRAFGDQVIVTVPVTAEALLSVIDRAESIAAAAADPDQAARATLSGPTRFPGRGWSPCDECPWLTRCLGPDAQPGEPVTPPDQDTSDAAVAELLVSYRDAMARERSAREDKAGVLQKLSGVPQGRYGENVLTRGKSSCVVDPHASAKLLADLGFTPPTTQRNGAVTIKPHRERRGRSKR